LVVPRVGPGHGPGDGPAAAGPAPRPAHRPGLSGVGASAAADHPPPRRGPAAAVNPSLDRRAAVYSSLPYPAKVLAASARGLRLRAWRYGPGSEGEVRRVLDRDRWEGERWQAWQRARLAAVLTHAAASVPHHRRWFARHPDRDPARLADWPVLTKADLLGDPAALVADDAPRRRYRDQTSGTSGSPLAVWTSRADLRAFFALHEARTRRWHG